MTLGQDTPGGTMGCSSPITLPTVLYSAGENPHPLLLPREPQPSWLRPVFLSDVHGSK